MKSEWWKKSTHQNNPLSSKLFTMQTQTQSKPNPFFHLHINIIFYFLLYNVVDWEFLPFLSHVLIVPEKPDKIESLFRIFVLLLLISILASSKMDSIERREKNIVSKSIYDDTWKSLCRMNSINEKNWYTFLCESSIIRHEWGQKGCPIRLQNDIYYIWLVSLFTHNDDSSAAHTSMPFIHKNSL